MTPARENLRELWTGRGQRPRLQRAPAGFVATPLFTVYLLLPMHAEAKPWGRSTLALLRAGPFRRYLLGTSISDTGTWMQMMAQGWVMSSLTNKAIMLGLVNFAAGLPMIFLVMVGGSFADRGDKRKILIWTQIVQIALALILGSLIYAGKIQIWHVIAVAGLLGIAFAFEHPALSALVPELVRHDEIASAIALDRAVFHGSRLMGPALAGIVVSIWNTATAFFANAFTFIAFIIALVSLPPRSVGSQEEEAMRASGIKDGFRYVRADRPSLAMVGMIAMMTICIFPTVTVMMPLYVRDVLHLGADKFGFLMAASGLGSIFGATALIMIPRGHRAGSMALAAAAIALSVLGLSRAGSFAPAFATMLTASLGLSLIFGLSNTIVQERAPSHLRGRVSAVMGLSFFGLMPFAGVGVTSLADAIGMRTALAAGGILYALGSLAILGWIGSRINHTPAPATPVTEAPPQVAAV